jgi:hypothetical protein
VFHIFEKKSARKGIVDGRSIAHYFGVIHEGESEFRLPCKTYTTRIQNFAYFSILSLQVQMMTRSSLFFNYMMMKIKTTSMLTAFFKHRSFLEIYGKI